MSATVRLAVILGTSYATVAILTASLAYRAACWLTRPRVKGPEEL